MYGKPRARGTVSLPYASALLEKYRARNGKTNSSIKQDVELILFDAGGNPLPRKGFSVKSWTGENPTLFNASGATRFCFHISLERFKEAETLHKTCINSRGHHQCRRLFGELNKQKILQPDFPLVKTDAFRRNLELIGGEDMPAIIGSMLRAYLTTKNTDVKKLLDKLIADNPLGYSPEDAATFYRYRIARFLRAAALGFTASDLWDGSEGAEGGMILISRDWRIGCYTAGTSEFDAYLIDRCYLDTASAEKSHFGYPYKGRVLERAYIDFALQVRERSPF